MACTVPAVREELVFGDRWIPAELPEDTQFVSPGVSLAEVAVSLTIFTLLYGALAVAEAVLLTRHVRGGPEAPSRTRGG